MRYYLIAGEASGDLHASHLMAALKAEDPAAVFRCYGGDLMAAQGGEVVQHYRDLAYMGVIDVVMHARTILRGLRRCKEDITQWHPDVVILVDYPGFNMKIAQYVHAHHLCPVYYYIAPKIWAWKEWRIRAIRRDVDQLFSILPFEVPFFEKKHHYPIHYIGNPTVDEVSRAISSPTDLATEGEGDKPCIALLPGSRRQEIRDNLSRMLLAVEPWQDDYDICIAAAPSIDEAFYRDILSASPLREKVNICFDKTYTLLAHATAALVTSGTATLETALFRVPQVVCYYMRIGRIATWGRRWVLKIPYISLVNLIADSEVVPELVADRMTAVGCRNLLSDILPGGARRETMLRGYDEVARRLGEPGAPQRAARLMIQLLRS